jgi:esterase
MEWKCKPVPLAAKVCGDAGEVVVFLHGLLGSSRNWRAISSMMADRFRVYALDMRNHGESPRTGVFGFDELACDVDAWIRNNLEGASVTLVGHSLGGKAAMRMACRSPELVKRLVLVDISSESAPRRWGPIFEVMLSLDLSTLKNRKEAEAFFESRGIADWGMRKFLASNLDDSGGAWRWKMALDTLAASSENYIGAVLEAGMHYDGPVLLIRGGRSDYAPEKDFPVMRAHFPKLEIETVENAGHNVHIDTPQSFVAKLEAFIARNP